MAFIPIHAKADIQNSKKGRLTPAQNAQLNAWCLSNKTGILDCLGKCEYNQSSSILSVSNNEAKIVFRSGYIVICGRLIECEENTSFTLNGLTDGQFGNIVLSCNLANSGEQEFTITKKIDTLDKEDLNNNPFTGKYDFVLYKYEVKSNIVELKRSEPYVLDMKGKFDELANTIKSSITGTGVVGDGNAPLQAYDKSKGTIEERLTALGFKQGTIKGGWTNSAGNSGTTEIGYVYKLGKVIYGKITQNGRGISSSANNDGGIKCIFDDGTNVPPPIDAFRVSFVGRSTNTQDPIAMFELYNKDNCLTIREVAYSSSIAGLGDYRADYLYFNYKI
jgi:hypothetical protein